MQNKVNRLGRVLVVLVGLCMIYYPAQPTSTAQNEILIANSKLPQVQSPQPLQQLPQEDPDNVTSVNPANDCFISYKTLVLGYPIQIRLQLCSIHYHFPPEHGSGQPGEWAVPDCPMADTSNYPTPPQWGHKPPQGSHGPNKPTKAPSVGDIVEIHYVYGWSAGLDGLSDAQLRRRCEALKNAALTNSLSSCNGPLVVSAVWARVSAGSLTPVPQDWSPFSPFGGTEYSGSTTGEGRPTKPAYWRINAGCKEVGIDDLDLDGTAQGKIQGHPSRPLQPK